MLRYVCYVWCYFVQSLHDFIPGAACFSTSNFLILLSCGFFSIIVIYDKLMEYIFRNSFTTTDLRIVCWAASKDPETPTHSVRDPAVMFYNSGHNIHHSSRSEMFFTDLSLSRHVCCLCFNFKISMCNFSVQCSVNQLTLKFKNSALQLI